jgi:hypothetical protein
MNKNKKLKKAKKYFLKKYFPKIIWIFNKNLFRNF